MIAALFTWWQGIAFFFSVIALAMAIATLLTWWLDRRGWF